MNASDFRQRDLHILPRDRKVVCHLWSKFFYQMTANECFTHSRVYTFIYDFMDWSKLCVRYLLKKPMV